MKIAILTPTYSQFSGIDRVVELQARKYVSRGNDVSIFCFKAGMTPQEDCELHQWGMPKNQTMQRVYRLIYFFDYGKIDALSDELKDYDLVISHLYPMNIVALAAKNKFGIKFVYHNHGVATPELFTSFVEKTYMKIFNWLTNQTVMDADEIVSISDYLRKQLLEETGRDSRIEYDPIDTLRFKHGVNGSEIVQKYNLGKSKVCLFVGRISPHKGIDLLIKSFNLVLKEKPNTKLLIVGKETFDSYAAEIKKLANEVNKDAIIFCGFVDDSELPKYYGCCDVYCTASLWEGYDMPIAEAWACNRPSVAYDIGPHKEVLKSGKLVPARDIKAFADAILEVMK